MNNVAVHVKLILVAAIWGLGWPAGRVVATELPPHWFRLGTLRDGRHRVLGLPKVVKPMDFTIQDTMEACRLDWPVFDLCIPIDVHVRHALHGRR